MELIYDFSKMTEDEIRTYLNKVDQNKIDALNEIERRKDARKKELIDELEGLLKEIGDLDVDLEIRGENSQVHLDAYDLSTGYFTIHADY